MLGKIKVFVALLATVALTTVFLPAAASAAPATISPQPVAAADSGPSIIPLPEGSTVDLSEVRTVDGHKFLVELVNPTSGKHISAPGEGVVTPQVTIGAGWYLYIYLNDGNVSWLLGLGFTAASTALCAVLTPSVLGGIACAAAAYIIWSVINSYRTPHPDECMEIRINWWGSLDGVKYVKRSC